MKKLLEERRQGKVKPSVELLLVEIGGIARLLLNGCRLVIYQEHGDVVRDARTSPELLFRKNLC